MLIPSHRSPSCRFAALRDYENGKLIFEAEYAELFQGRLAFIVFSAVFAISVVKGIALPERLPMKSIDFRRILCYIYLRCFGVPSYGAVDVCIRGYRMRFRRMAWLV